MENLKNIEINPLKTSSSLGAVIVFLGIKNAVVLMHGSQGCASFDKVTLTKHYRENIPVYTTALNELGAILGGSSYLKAGVKNIADKINPAFIGVTSTGLSEVNGEDICATFNELKKELKESASYDGLNVAYVSTPDYDGNFEEGYKNAILSLLQTFCIDDAEETADAEEGNNTNIAKIKYKEQNEEQNNEQNEEQNTVSNKDNGNSRANSLSCIAEAEKRCKTIDKNNIGNIRNISDYKSDDKNKNNGANDIKNIRANVFCPFSFTAMDFLELRELLEDFGITPVMLPDLGTSMDGHLDENGYLQTTSGGTDIEDLKKAGLNNLNIIIGNSLKSLIAPVKKITGLNTYYFSNVSGLKNTDLFFKFLEEISLKNTPERYKRQKRQLMDAYLDTHFYFLGKNIAIAEGIDILDSFSEVLCEVGANIKIGVTTSKAYENLKNRFEILAEGDIDLFSELIKSDDDGIDLVISNSNAGYTAEKIGAPILKVGFPLIDRIGHNFKHYILYKGSANLVYESANLLMSVKEKIMKEV
jgi:nitrogenase molybdenum-iron protein NifN